MPITEPPWFVTRSLRVRAWREARPVVARVKRYDYGGWLVRVHGDLFACDTFAAAVHVAQREASRRSDTEEASQ